VNQPDTERLELRLSETFLAASAFSPVALLGLGLWGLLRAGEVRVVPLVLLVVGGVLAVAVASDLPHRVELTAEGITRRCPLRRQFLAWDEVVSLSRTRIDRSGQRLFGRAVGGLRSSKVGGLVAVVGPKRRRYLLTDRQERPDQWHELQRLVGRWAPGVALPSGPPTG
jgi:hypothetical protein